MISKKAEFLLKELINNKDNFIELLQNKFDSFDKNGYIDSNSDMELRSILKELQDQGLLTKITWGDGKPIFSTITPLGEDYLNSKSEETSAKIETFYNQSITFGENAKITNSKIGNTVKKSDEQNNKLIWQILIPIFVTVIGGLIVWLLTSL